MKNILFSLLFIFLFSSAYCRQDSLQVLNHSIGVQANELLKQLINLNNSATAIENPFLLTYSCFLSKQRWGIQAGFGGRYHKIKDKISVTGQESRISETFYRIGLAKQWVLGRRWEASAGIDYQGSYQLNKTFSATVTDFSSQKDSTTSISTTLKKINGAGLQLRLSFVLSNHISICTESTVYYSAIKNQSNVLFADVFTSKFNPDQNRNTITSTNSDIRENEITITIPVAIFLVVKF